MWWRPPGRGRGPGCTEPEDVGEGESFMIAGGLGNVYEGAETVMEAWRCGALGVDGGNGRAKGGIAKEGKKDPMRSFYTGSNRIDERHGGRTSK